MARTLSEMAPWLDRMALGLYRERSLHVPPEQLEQWLNDHPRLLVILNHGPMLGPVPALVALGQTMADHGGEGRVPFGLTWSGFYDLPGLRQLASRLTQTDHRLDVDETVKRLTEGPYTDCCIMPEGELCNVGNGVDVQPFRSGRFIEVAVRAQIPILLVAHHGTAQLARTLEVSGVPGMLERWIPDHYLDSLTRSGVVSVPWLLGGRIPHLRMTAELYQPDLSPPDLSQSRGPLAVAKESQRVRARLQRLVNQLVLASELDEER